MAVAVGDQSAPLDGDSMVWDRLVTENQKEKCKERFEVQDENSQQQYRFFIHLH